MSWPIGPGGPLADGKALVEGFTDNVGSEAGNQGLSHRRAQSVRPALVARGVDADRLTTHGCAKAYPVAGNDSAGGRQANRRVEAVHSDDSGSINARLTGASVQGGGAGAP